VLVITYIFHSVVKVETEVIACRSYARSHTEINNQSMALVKKYILKRFFSQSRPENVTFNTEVSARHSYERSRTEIIDLNMDGIGIDAVRLQNETR
jgi:hypothetical protein